METSSSEEFPYRRSRAMTSAFLAISCSSLAGSASSSAKNEVSSLAISEAMAAASDACDASSCSFGSPEDSRAFLA